MRVETEHVYPPIPDRSHDWRATLDGYDPGDPVGYGRTEGLAVLSLLDRCLDEWDSSLGAERVGAIMTWLREKLG